MMPTSSKKYCLAILLVVCGIRNCFSSQEDTFSTSELIRAVEKGKLRKLRQIVEAHPEALHTTYSKRITLLHGAAKKGRLSIVQYLVKKGLDVNAFDGLHMRPLHEAALKNHLQVAVYLIENGAQVNAVDLHGTTALSIAARNGHLDLVTYLVENGAFVNTREDECNYMNISALHEASWRGHVTVVCYLLEKGADVHARNQYEQTPLHLAAQGKQLLVMKHLVKHGGQVNDQDERSETPLHDSLYFYGWQVAKYLINNRAEVNALNIHENTPLHIAARHCIDKYSHKLRDVIIHLLEHGADIHAKNKKGETPLSIITARAPRTHDEFKLVVYFIHHHATLNPKELQQLEEHCPIFFIAPTIFKRIDQDILSKR